MSSTQGRSTRSSSTELPELLTVDEACVIFRVGKGLLYSLARSPNPPPYIRRIGGRVFASRQAIQKWLAEGEGAASSATIVRRQVRVGPQGVRVTDPPNLDCMYRVIHHTHTTGRRFLILTVAAMDAGDDFVPTRRTVFEIAEAAHETNVAYVRRVIMEAVEAGWIAITGGDGQELEITWRLPPPICKEWVE